MLLRCIARGTDRTFPCHDDHSANYCERPRARIRRRPRRRAFISQWNVSVESDGRASCCAWRAFAARGRGRFGLTVTESHHWLRLSLSRGWASPRMPCARSPSLAYADPLELELSPRWRHLAARQRNPRTAKRARSSSRKAESRRSAAMQKSHGADRMIK